MSKAGIVIRKEYLERVKGKGFIISTILIPVIFSAFILIPLALAFFTSSDGKEVYAIVDETGVINAPALRASSDAKTIFEILKPEDKEIARQHTVTGKFTAYVVLSNDSANSETPFKAIVYSKNVGDFESQRLVRNTLQRALRSHFLSQKGYSEMEVKVINDPLKLETQVVSKDEGKSDKMGGFSGFIVAYVMVFLIYGTIFSYGAVVSSSVMEEKSSKVMEVMAASVTPFDLMLGKIVGIGLVGFTQYLIWSVVSFGMSAVSLSMSTKFNFSLPASLLVYFVLFFIYGYLLFATIYAAIGSAFENAQDAQSVQAPISMLVIIPILVVQYVISKPDSTFSVIMSLIPFFSPILMMGRIASSDVPVWQIALCFFIMTATFYGILKAAAKIYRIGILMYGKKPTLGEIVKWARYS
ncbi:MAG: ABC transporter permease [Chloroherpetonaceae bacterium]|nr:ABC transporter permease [Chloroherpetonaceae bacterium]